MIWPNVDSALERIWTGALDASHSDDFRIFASDDDEEGELDEVKYEQYKAAEIALARKAINDERDLLVAELDRLRGERQEAARHIEELERQRDAVLALCDRYEAEPIETWRGDRLAVVETHELRAIYGGGQ